MEWFDGFYAGENASEKIDKIVSKINEHKLLLDVYVITLAANPENNLDIYPANELLQKHFQTSDLFIVGVAKGKDEADELVQEIVMDCYKKTGTFDVKNLVNSTSVV